MYMVLQFPVPHKRLQLILQRPLPRDIQPNVGSTSTVNKVIHRLEQVNLAFLFVQSSQGNDVKTSRFRAGVWLSGQTIDFGDVHKVANHNDPFFR